MRYKVTDKDATYRVNILKKVTVEDCLDLIETVENYQMRVLEFS